MTYKQLATITFLLIITASCQQANLNHTTPVDDTHRSSANNNANPSFIGTNGTLTAPTQKPPLEKQCQASSQLPGQTMDVVSENETKSEGQEKIDQALELCSDAQKMWEKGNLDEALNNLDSAYYLILEIDRNTVHELSQQKEDVRYLISKRILEIYASRQLVVTGLHDEIPITMNSFVQAEIKRLTGRERKFFIQSMERAARYRPFIVAELKKAGLPEELSWLPLIESGYKLRALSSARALGLWQFIPSTGHKFGLSRNQYIDERMDPEKSTLAAIAYLKELHNLFGDWTTALASYNCGEYRVLKTIRRQKINYLDNFWDLHQNLPRETARYVPRFLATLYIVNNLEKYNMKIKNPLPPLEYSSFGVTKQVLLKDIAKAIDVPPQVLARLNPELRHSLLPPETYQLKIPKDKASGFLAKIDKMTATYSPPPMYVYHRVRRGDTLSGIAKRYKTRVSTISRANKISKTHTLRVGKVLKIPGKKYKGNVNRGTQKKVNRSLASKPIRYKVNRGDNLWIIAERFSTTTKQIMISNKLPSTKLQIGQTLYILPANTSSKNQAVSTKKPTSVYRVRSGDSPFIIAQKHKMELNRFLSLNHLNKRSKIFPGQKLKIE
jgi:peptidoglycan lytic transglycosylase D